MCILFPLHWYPYFETFPWLLFTTLTIWNSYCWRSSWYRIPLYRYQWVLVPRYPCMLRLFFENLFMSCFPPSILKNLNLHNVGCEHFIATLNIRQIIWFLSWRLTSSWPILYLRIYNGFRGLYLSIILFSIRG